MSEETQELVKEYMGMHGVSIMAMVCSDLSKKGFIIGVPTVPGNIWDASIRITKKVPDGEDMVSELYLQNTFIEVMCVDRDDDPLVFDPKILENGMYIFQKIECVVESRLTMIYGLMDGKTIEEIYEENPGMFERIRKKEIKKDKK